MPFPSLLGEKEVKMLLVYGRKLYHFFLLRALWESPPSMATWEINFLSLVQIFTPCALSRDWQTVVLCECLLSKYFQNDFWKFSLLCTCELLGTYPYTSPIYSTPWPSINSVVFINKGYELVSKTNMPKTWKLF